MKATQFMARISPPALVFAVLTLIAALSVEPVDARPGARGGSAMRSGPASAGSVRGAHRDNRQDRRSNRRDNRREVRDNRHDNRKDFRNERREWHEDRWRRHRARHITRSAFRSLSCRTTVIVADGITYYSCGGTYYERVYQGGTVVYVIVSAP